MIEQGIAKIEDMARADYLKTKIGEEHYMSKKLTRIKRPDQQKPEAFTFRTLTGLVNYIETNLDDLKYDDLCVHVESPTLVKLYGQLQPTNDNDRFFYAGASLDLKSFSFGTWHELEMFIIALQSQFIETDAINDILSVLGNLASEQIRENKDDGFTQVVQVKVGIALRREVELKNPITLQPYRTFREIEQPESATIMRLRQVRGEIECVLFESDGGAWKLDAMKRIKAWIESKMNSAEIPVFA